MLCQNCLSQFVFSFVAVASITATGFAQRNEGEPEGIQIERMAVSLRSPQEFHIPLQLRPAKSVRIVAPMDGAVNKIFFKAGDEIAAQAELIRFDSQERSIELQIAKAEFELAKAEAALAAGTGEKSAAEANVNVARKKLDLAEFRDQQTIIHSPLTGRLAELRVVEGEYVRAGDLLAVVYEPQQLVAEIPIERGKVEAGAEYTLQIETDEADAKVDAILAPLQEFDPLRELFVSVATARLLLETPDGEFQAGQGVTSDMIPRHPVAEVPIDAIRTDDKNPDSERMIQVIRDGFVRSLPIQLLGQVGQTHVFVSARFSEGDEVIVSSSEELLDGSWVRPMMLDEQLDSRAGQQSRTTGRQTSGGTVLGPDGIRRPIYNRESD